MFKKLFLWMNMLELLVTSNWNRLWWSQGKIKNFGDGCWGQQRARRLGLENGQDTRETKETNQQGQINSHHYSCPCFPPLGFSGSGGCPIECVCATCTPSVCTLHGQAGRRYTYPRQLARLGAGDRHCFPPRLHTLGKNNSLEGNTDVIRKGIKCV